MDLGTGLGGGGLLSSVLFALGIKQRIDYLENKMVIKDTCKMCQEKTEEHFKAVHSKLDMLIEHSLNRRGSDK